LRDEIDLLDAAGDPFDLDKVLAGELTPMFFGSAMNNFGVESFLKNCKCHYDEAKGVYNITSVHKLMATMLDSDKNKKFIFDAMVCCDVNIDSVKQIKVSYVNNKVQESDLDEF
ncbi:MAG: hypothetical protein II357_03830, partial [Clostridia bacterium]|nr:hypothetical protein [Clostridia bacterium]